MKTKSKHPGSVKKTPSLKRAEFLLASGDAESALYCATQVLKTDREQIGALEIKAKALWQLARYEVLLVTLATLIRLNPYEPGYFALRGAVYQALGRVGEAVKEFARAGEDTQVAAESIRELRDWQETVISQLLAEDSTFKLEYARDPEGACRSRGFEFLPEFRLQEKWLAGAQPAHVASVRPS